MLFLPIAIFLILLIAVISSYIILPSKDAIPLQSKDSFILNNENNFIETQSHFDCAGYAVAYILRSLKKKADGKSVYNSLKYKLFKGLILPKSIIHYFNKEGIKAAYYKGTIETLKQRLQNGIPVIVFIKVFQEKNYFHFAVLIGFSDNRLFFAESLPLLQTKSTAAGNREITIEDFKKLWNISIPFHKNTYIAIE